MTIESNNGSAPPQAKTQEVPIGSVLAHSPNGKWTPTVTLDIVAAKQKDFDEKFREFYRVSKDRALPSDLVGTGWYTVTPQLAESLLLSKANRRISFSHVQYLARQMKEGAWIRTGQTLIITQDNLLREGYHRCWAAYLSGASFDTFIVTDVPMNEYFFAYLDNGKPRSAAEGLQTAGMNGVSPMIAATVKLSVCYETGFFNPHKRVYIPRMTPIETIRYVKTRPTLHDSVNEVVSEYKKLLRDLLPRKKSVACFTGWMISDLYGADSMEEFFIELESEDAQGPVGLLRAKLLADADGRTKYSTKEVLAYIIKAFNAWHTGKAMRRLSLATDEPFPQFVEPAVQQTSDDEDDVEEEGEIADLAPEHNPAQAPAPVPPQPEPTPPAAAE